MMKVHFKQPLGHFPDSMVGLGYSPSVELHLQTGIQYIVYGLSIWRSVLHYLIIPSGQSLPNWYPADLFDIIDPQLPNNWYFHYFGVDHPGKVSLEVGYKEMVLDSGHSTELIERDKDAIDIFVKRKKEIDLESC